MAQPRYLDMIPYLLSGATIFVASFLLRRWKVFWARAHAIGPDLPGFRLVGWILPFPPPWKRLRGVSASGRWLWQRKFLTYEEFELEMYSTISAFPRVRAGVHVADPAVVKEITLSRSRFPKPVRLYRPLEVFGPNIVSSEFDTHRKYRKAVAPSFNERNNKLVWDAATSLALGLFKTKGWRGKDIIAIDHCVDITLPIALGVIGIAGFGRHMTWDEAEIPIGHVMSFKDALTIASVNLHVKIIMPRWFSAIRPSWSRAATAFDELDVYMREMIQQRRNQDQLDGDHPDLFSGLLERADDPEDALTDEELIGNVFIFLIAGHETTAHTLAFTFGLLALYQDEQEALYNQISSVIGPSETLPGYEDMQKLSYPLAVFYETLRLYPPVTTIAKYAAEDVVLTANGMRKDGTHYTRPVFVPKDTPVAINITGMHYNPRYWDAPHEFRPSRFLGDYPRDAFMPFSNGPRACIGRRFFETEGVAVLTAIVSRYHISVRENADWAGFSLEEKREKLLKAKLALTLTPQHVPLVFTRRA